MPNIDVTKRFWSKVSQGNSTSCWNWLGYIRPDRGNGTMKFRGQPYPAHRLALLFSGTNLAESDYVIPTCGNKLCCNPAHLSVKHNRPYETKNESDFWSDVNTGQPHDCWEWMARKDKDGYGKTKFKGRSWAAHRLAATLSGIDIPDGKCVCHHCDNTSCCNPLHLFVGTEADNNKDRSMKGRSRDMLSRATISEILKQIEAGESYRKIAKQFNCTDRAVSGIALGVSYRHWTGRNTVSAKRKFERVSSETLRKIKELRATGASQQKIADNLGISQAVVSQWLRRSAH